MLEPRIPDSLVERLSDAENVLVISHKEPDGDCIGASLAAGSVLSRLGKRVDYFNVGPFDRREIKEYAGHFSGTIPDTRRAEPGTVSLVLDCSTSDRIGELQHQLDGIPVCVIDHHAGGEPFGDYRWVVAESPSTTYLVLLLIEALGSTPTREEADLLMFGFCTDTGFFRHIAPHQGFAFHGLSRLTASGASPKTAHAQMFGGRTLASRHLIGRLISRLQEYYGGRLLATWETLEDTEQVGKENRDSDTFYELMFSVDTCDALIYLRQESPEKCTGSLRSRDQVDVAAVAQRFGGGGHKNAAGFLAEGTPETLLPQIVEAFTGSPFDTTENAS